MSAIKKLKPKMKKQLLIVLFAIMGVASSWAQQGNPWKPVTKEKAAAGEVKPLHDNVYGTYFTLDAAQMKQTLRAATPTNAVVISVPVKGGKTEHFSVTEYSNFDEELQAMYPEIRAYAGKGIEDPSANINFSFSPKGIQTMIMRADKSSEFIEPYTKDGEVYILFTRNDKKGPKMPFTCYTDETRALHDALDSRVARGVMASNAVFKKFRLALSVTGEYTQYHGGTVNDALQAMNATMTRVNGIYAIDLAVKLELIPNTNLVVYTNPNTDPYDSIQNWNAQLQARLNSVIGNANYDIGHLFGAAGGGGNAGCIGCVCVANEKGSGITSPSNGQPEGDSFDIDYVAHEMGHQLGGTHTFSFDVEGDGTNVEPGSGSTIMSYAGITGALTDVQARSDAYFTYRTIAQIQANLQNKACAVNTPINNPAMVIEAGANYTIPRGTAFVLKAVGANVNPANTTYCWEQNDNPTSTATLGGGSVVSPTKPNGPNFRSYPPTTSPDRYMPKLEKVLNGTLTSDWESVSTVNRQLNFTLTGRDNVATGGQTKTDNMTVTVTTGAGPFVVTSQNAANISYETGSTQTISWNVAGTTGAGVNTALVNIKLSINGGLTFPYTLVANTPNDGSESVTLPAGVSAPFCRIMVEAVNNIFYAVNTTTFAIGYTVTEVCNTYTNSTVTPIPDGASAYSASAISVPVNGPISDIDVSVNIAHSYVSDLVLILASPTNTQNALWVRQCGSNDNMNVTFDDSGNNVICASPVTGTIRPAESFSIHNGISSQGQWLLGFRDFEPEDAGVLNSWSLRICVSQATAGTNEYGLQDFKLYPNPNSGSFTVEFNSDSASEVQILVHDIRGRQIMSKSYENSGLFSGNISLGNAGAGVYLVTVQDGNRKEVKRIVVQ